MIDFLDGGIVKRTAFGERAAYDTGNHRISVKFDGTGGIERYSVMNKFSVFSAYYTLFSFNGQAFDWSGEKTVTMIGRIQKIEFSAGGADITVKQFLDETTNAVFNEIAVTAKEPLRFDTTVNFGINFSSYVECLLGARLNAANLFRIARGVFKKKKKRIETGEISCIRGDIMGDFYLDIAANTPLTDLESERGSCNQFTFGGEIEAGRTRTFRYAVGAGTRGDFSFSEVKDCIRDFDARLANAEEYSRFLRTSIPDDIKDDEKQKAYYVSLLNCALSNYKELGDFKGFLAGVVYQFPARTYFRDAYWTVLAVLSVCPALVKNELLTLARGIDKKTGNCPSAVKYNFKNHWGDHYDSPSFFVMAVYDYITATGDSAVIDEAVNGVSVLTLCVKVLERLSQKADATGLIVKGGKYNRRDWCDNVFRSGYVTYDEALYAKALFALSEFFKLKNDTVQAEKYRSEFMRVKDAINSILWDEKKGYFVNYKDGDFTEDNLSIDTVVTVLYGLCDGDRAVRVLKNMEDILESKNNTRQCAGDFGVMSVYPFYRDARAAVQKSSLPYSYHNGGDWPYLSNMYAYAKYMYGLDGEYPLTRWFDYNLDKGNYTPVEFFSPLHPAGSLLQAWSATGAFVLSHKSENFFGRVIDKRI
ncbi:MAG: hypothetical protein LBT20_07390 [Clostridiales bacterium]|jgi:GH15 family glucan-1,4-alpha-glucosidase|nr:hypothetical protein [Clostridiales bacterium]